MAALSRELRGNRSSLRNMILSKPGPSLHTLLWLAKRLELRSIEELFGDFGSYQAIASVEALTEGQDAGA